MVDLSEWDAFTVRWRDRLDRVGARYGLAGEDLKDELGGALQRAFRAMRGLLGAYEVAVRAFAAVRRSALQEVEGELDRAKAILRGKSGAAAVPPAPR